MRAARAMIAAVIGVMVLSCSSGPPDLSLRLMSLSYMYTITPDKIPPSAGEAIHYTVTVRDRKTLQPVLNGEGRLFASNIDHAKTWDGFAYGPEVGTYHATVDFVVGGVWALALEFRRDSLTPLERTDWQQDVGAEVDSVIH